MIASLPGCTPLKAGAGKLLHWVALHRWGRLLGEGPRAWAGQSRLGQCQQPAG